MNMTFDFDSTDAFTNFVYETAVSIQTILSNQTEIEEKRYWEQLLNHLGNMQTSMV
jgi:predicted 3-demethylubiquinone-9 3-methyltransferase (glyoxalase superfamily)